MRKRAHAELRDSDAASPPTLPPVNPDELEEAARRFVSRTKPPGGWKPKRDPKPHKDDGGG